MMKGAIQVLQDLRKLCSARNSCTGCPVAGFCNQNHGIRTASNMDLCELVQGISFEAAYGTNKTVFLTRYEEVRKFHPADGGTWLTGMVPDERFSVEMKVCDVAGTLEHEAAEWLHAFRMTDGDIVFRDQYEIRWEKDGYTVTLVYPDPARSLVYNFVDCGDSEDGEFHESYHAYLSISVKNNDHIDGSYFVEYIPESMQRLHERPPIYS